MTATEQARAAKRERVEFARGVYKNDLFLFATDCLGYDKLGEVHREWCRDAQDMLEAYEQRKPGYTKRRLWLMPRGTYKSTVLTVAFGMFALIRNPNLRILIPTGKEGAGKNFLHEIKKHMEQNAKFRTCFGKWNEGADIWTTTAIVINARTQAKKEPSILVVGKGSQITSMHFDIALPDDIVTDEDRDSYAAREASIQFLKDLESIMEQESLTSAIGTHWHHDDAYTWIRRIQNDELIRTGKQPWRCHIEGPYETDGKTERFPEILGDLEELKIRRGLMDYYANIENNPLPPDTQLFRPDDLSYFRYDPDEYLHFDKFCFWDPASSKPKAGSDPDYNAMPVLARTAETYDLIDVWMKQDKPSVAYAMALELAKGYNLRHLRVETNHLPDGSDNLETNFRKAGIATAVSGVKNTGAKAARIETLEPLCTSGRIRFRDDWRECSQSYRIFMEQLTMYPVASHDDGPDALQGCYELAALGTAPSGLQTPQAQPRAGEILRDEDLDEETIWGRDV